MTETWMNLPHSERQDILHTAATTLGRQAAVLEKDIWVCWVLQVLFSIPDAHPMAFKGGTSLSKVYRIIDRFSEDIDITLDYRHFDEAFDPFSENASKNQIRKYAERLKSQVKCYANDVIIPALRSAVRALPEPSLHTISQDTDGEKIWFNFPSVTEIQDGYMKSQVLIELGGRNSIDPNERHEITPDLASLTPGLSYPACEVVVLSPERTFWEKATLIHAECHREPLRAGAKRLARHWYDLAMLARHSRGQAAIRNRPLFESVVRHKQVFYPAGHAQYDSCLEGALTLVPSSRNLAALQQDYEAMLRAGMMYQQAPEFKQLIEEIHQLQQAINHL